MNFNAQGLFLMHRLYNESYQAQALTCVAPVVVTRVPRVIADTFLYDGLECSVIVLQQFYVLADYAELLLNPASDPAMVAKLTPKRDLGDIKPLQRRVWPEMLALKNERDAALADLYFQRCDFGAVLAVWETFTFKVAALFEQVNAALERREPRAVEEDRTLDWAASDAALEAKCAKYEALRRNTHFQ